MLKDIEITIIGAGPVGCTLALMLEKYHPNPEKIVLCQLEHQLNHQDPRILAINHGSQMLFKDIGAWSGQATPIKTVHVSQRGRLGRTLITAQEYQLEALGWVMSYGMITAALEKALQQSAITVLRGAKAIIRNNTAQGVHIEQGSNEWHSQIVIQAEGGTYDQQHRKDWSRDYHQHAILCTVEVSHTKPNCAWERFTSDGPIALLPHPNQQPSQYGLIWCVPPQQAERLLALDDSAFGDALQYAFGDYLGRMRPIGVKSRYPLGANYRSALVDQRVVYVGNAAQTLHPVSGQGLNLGLRDAAELSFALSATFKKNNHSLPWDAVLHHYAAKRTFDRQLGRTVTDILPRILSHNVATIQHMGGLSLTAFDTCKTIRQSIGRQFMYGQRY